jgi:hypothetical protein
VAGEQTGDVSDSTNVFVAVALAESEVAIEMLAELVGVEDFSAQIESGELCCNRVR